MKIAPHAREKPKFQPLTITFETPEEVAALLLLGQSKACDQTAEYKTFAARWNYPAVRGQVDVYTVFEAALAHLRANKEAL